MEIVRELVRIINLKKIKRIKTLYAESKEEDVYSEMYRLVAKDVSNKLTENDLALKITGVSKENKKFGMVKTRFIKKALNQIQFLDSSELISDESKEIIKGHRLAFLARIMYLFGAKKSGLYLLNKATPILEKYELLDDLINVYKKKLVEYSSFNKTKKFNNTAIKLTDTAKKIQQEVEITIIYERIGKIYNKSEILKKDDIEKLKEEIDKLNKIKIDEDSSFLSQWHKKTLIIEYNEFMGEYQKVLNDVELLQNLFVNKTHFYLKPRRILIDTWKLEAYGKLNKKREGEELVCNINKRHKIINFNWFHIQRKIVFFYIDTEQYLKAYEVATKVIYNKIFKNYNERFKELWVLWYNFLKIYNFRCNVEQLRNVRIYKVLNSIQNLTKDKLGVNTSKIVLELLYNILVNNLDEVIESYNILSIYKYRYLKPNKLKRSIIFFDFITISSRSAFEKKAISENAQLALKKLNNLPLYEFGKSTYEIIPYETLINIIVEKINK